MIISFLSIIVFVALCLNYFQKPENQVQIRLFLATGSILLMVFLIFFIIFIVYVGFAD